MVLFYFILFTLPLTSSYPGEEMLILWPSAWQKLRLYDGGSEDGKKGSIEMEKKAEKYLPAQVVQKRKRP